MTTPRRTDAAPRDGGPDGFNEGTVFRSLFAASPDGLLLVDAAGRILLANPAASELLGYAPDELVALNIDALVPDAIRPRHAEFRDAYARAPRPRPMGTQMDLVAKRRDGSEVMVEIALSPLQSQGLPYVMASVRGVGEYPRVKQALQRARYSEHLAQLGRVAVDSRDVMEVLRQSPAIAAHALEVELCAVYLLESDRQWLRVAGGVGLLDSESLGSRLPNRSDIPTGFVVSQGCSVIVEDFLAEPRFTVPPAYLAAGLRSSVAVPLSDRGRLLGVISARSRQTRRFGDAELRFLEAVANLLATCLQRAHTEEALSHSQRLESVGQLTGGIAHDFNNLLTIIQGNLQVLSDLPAVGGDGFAPQLVAAALRASRRGADLTKQLLAFSRRQVLQPTPVDPRQMLESLADMLRRTVDQRIRIQVEVADGCPEVLVDPAQLESAVLNIAINARDAMPDGGTLRFEAEPVDAPPPDLRVELGADAASARYVRVSIVDTGSGMSDEVKEHAFEPFFTTKREGRGTGLGLSTVYGFARQSRGAVWIDSVVGQGTRIHLLLPRPGADGVMTMPQDATRGAVPAGLRVLLVEDDAEVRAVALRFLKDLGCVAQACDHAAPALELLGSLAERGEDPPDCLLTDVSLGVGMRGTELVEVVQRDWPRVRCLLMSGFSSDLLDEGREGPLPADLLPKPYTRDQLADALARLMRD